MSTKKALFWVLFWICAALCFDAGIWYFMGQEKAVEFLGGYVLEQSLSIDNLFLFITLFASFGIKPDRQGRVLGYGIMGAIILRLIFILLGVAVINKFHWVLYIFGVILIVSAYKMAFGNDEEKDFSDSKIIKVMRRFITMTEDFEGEKFFVKKGKILYATPLFAVLIVIEFTDVLFAVDSIPSVFSITTDAFIVYTSNIFAIVGLRNMYFILGKLHEKFEYVKYGVAAILAFTGVKLTLLIWSIHIPTVVSLLIILAILVLSVIISMAVTRDIPAGADAE